MYLALKLIHTAALVIFLGNIRLAIVWKLDADRSRDPRIIGLAAAAIRRRRR